MNSHEHTSPRAAIEAMAARRVTVDHGYWHASDGAADDPTSETRPTQVVVPAEWSDSAARAFADLACYPERLPRFTRPIGATNVPEALWRSGIDKQALKNAPREQRYVYEHNAFDVTARISGGLTYTGWRLGYFDTTEDALAFRDTLQWLLLTRKLVPGAQIWSQMGLHWAYGINGDDRGKPAYSLTTDQQDTQRVTALIEHPDLSDLNPHKHAAQQNSPPADLSDIMAVLADGASADWQAASGLVGQHVLITELKRLTEALKPMAVMPVTTLVQEPAIALAITTAREAGLPDTLIARALFLHSQNRPDRLNAWIAQASSKSSASHAPEEQISLSLKDQWLENAVLAQEQQLDGQQAVLTGAVADAAGLLDGLAWAGWTRGQPGMAFDDTAAAWSPLCGEASAGSGNSVTSARIADLPRPMMTVMPSTMVTQADQDTGAPDFDLEGFIRANRVALTALDIAISQQHWSDEATAELMRDCRPLGLNLGPMAGILSAYDVSYDSAAGRATLSALVALQAAIATGCSAELAQRLGACPAGHHDNAAMLDRLSNRERAAQGATMGYRGLDIHPLPFHGEDCVITALADAVPHAWEDALAMAHDVGQRNVLTTCLAQPGRIGLIADAFQPALSAAQPYMADDEPSALAQIDMMASCQPFCDGTIEMTVAMPAETELDETADLILKAWRRGLHGLRLFRTAGPSDQPWGLPYTLADITMGPDQSRMVDDADMMAARALDAGPATHADKPTRRTLPGRRKGYTQKATVGGHKVYLRTGEYEDGNLGEIFIDMHKEGAAFRSLMNNFAVAISIGLQYGVPLEEFVEAFTFTRFDPAGPVEGNDTVKMATSVLDYLFRELAISYLGRDDLAHAKAEDVRHDSLGTGDAQGDLPTAPSAIDMLHRLASRGYIRERLHDGQSDDAGGPDQSREAQAMAMGYLAEPCAHCGNLTMMPTDMGATCRTCGATRSNQDQGNISLV
ncbi:MAG: hypothetical protein AAF213_05540 [Pseudomonadota bacterium]